MTITPRLSVLGFPALAHRDQEHAIGAVPYALILRRLRKTSEFPSSFPNVVQRSGSFAMVR